MATAEHREPYDPRGSRTVLGARGGEIPRATRQVVISIAGKKHWLWRAVDQHGLVLDILVQSRRDKKAAKRLFRKLLKKQGRAPRVLVTETAFYVANTPLTAARAAEVVRAHWRIETTSHDSRDVTFGEDRSRIRSNPGAFARLRRFAFNSLKANRSGTLSQDRYRAALDNLLRLLVIL